MTDISQIKVGVQLDINKYGSPVKSVSLETVLDKIASNETLKELTDKVRASEGSERDALKVRLPAVIISADTTCRKVSDEDTRTGLILIDLDGKDHPDMLIDEIVAIVDEMVASYPYVIGYCRSVSWKGLKVLCGISPDTDLHLRSFLALESIFRDHNLIVDRQCKDLKRINFLCHDPDVHTTLTGKLRDWNGEQIEPAPKVVRKQYQVTQSYGNNRSPDDEASLCLEKLDPDMDYGEWLAIGMGLKAHGASCSTWDSWSASGQSYKQGECERKWNSFKGSGTGFGTVVQMAKQSNGGENPLFPKKFKRVDVGVDFSEIEEVEETEESEESEAPAEDKLWQWLQTRAFDEMNPPVVTPAILNLGDAPVIWLQNIHTLVAGSKSGKTHAMASMIRSWVTGERSLGWNCEKIDGRVVYLDFEQDSEDFYNVLFKHAGVTSHDVSAYRCAGLSVGSALKAVEMILERTPNVKVLIMDGYADLIMDTNDSGESNDSVARWMKLATDHNIAIVGALHLNPNSESKSRGHLGSQLERKSKTVLKIDVDENGVRETYTQLARKQMVFKGHGVFWKWEGNGFIEVMGHAEQKVHDKMVEDRAEFDKFCRLSLTKEWAFSDILADIQSHLGYKETAAKSRITLWKDYGFIEKPDNSLKYLAK